jgi:hypothetical protein
VELSARALKELLIEEHARLHRDTTLVPSDLKVIYSGRRLTDDEKLYEVLPSKVKKSQYRLVVTGVSSSQTAELNHELRQAARSAPRVRDDLTEQGRTEIEQRQRVGQFFLQKSASKSSSSSSKKYGFGRIEVLPNLPDQEQSLDILTRLANDPGVLACMAKHRWNVGCLAELYPDGNVGQSAVCVMGLNENKGQRILLRIRTDDLKGFRKMLSIRKVLFHELAHNVHSEHDSDFFVLMRQIERECNEMDWTQGHGLSRSPMTSTVSHLYAGGTYRLGGGSTTAGDPSMQSPRELAAQAALARMTAEEEEIQMNCGCGRQDLFLPTPSSVNRGDSPSSAAPLSGSPSSSGSGMDLDP